MMKKLFLTAMTSILLAFGLITISCDNGVQEIKGTIDLVYDKGTPVASVKVQKTNDNSFVVISMDAVDNGGSYNVVLQMEGKKTVNSIGNAQNLLIYSLYNGATSNNTDPDKWSFRYATTGTLIQAGKKYRFGVRVQPFTANWGIPSDIVWSGYIQF